MNSEPETLETPISIALPPKYWTIILALVDSFAGTTVKTELDKLRSDGTELKDIRPEKVTALAGPFLIKGIIIKELVAKGIMKPEADEKMGIDTLMDLIAKNSKV